MPIQVCVKYTTFLHKVAMEMKVCVKYASFLHKVAMELKVCVNNAAILHKKEEVSFWAPPLGIFVGKKITSSPSLHRTLLHRQVLPLRRLCTL